MPSYQLGFQNYEREVDETLLTCSASLPGWLNGSLIRTGPAKYTVGQQSMQHWFDGLAMLHRFGFADGKINYTSRFLKSNAYCDAERGGKIASREFATNPEQSMWQRLASLFSLGPTDNGNVNVARVDNCFLALTETPVPIQFEPGNLSTVGHFAFEDKLGGQVSTAHPHFDGGIYFNLLTHLGPTSTYQLYAIDSNSRKRRLLAALPTGAPSYIHSFAITERYVILIESPLVVNPIELILSGKPYIENYHWRNNLPMRLFAFDKNGGGLVRTFATEAGFLFHTVNAFERDREIVVDTAMYKDASIIKSLYLKNLRSHNNAGVATASLLRLRLNLDNNSVTREEITSESIELPRINYQLVNGRDYQYLFAGGVELPGNFFDQLLKIDVRSGASLRWSEAECYPGEPVFVAEPNSNVEDKGVVLSLVVDAAKEQCFLLILDGQTMQEIARSYVPFVIPFHFHGHFFKGVIT